jgi:hypothetical protein
MRWRMVMEGNTASMGVGRRITRPICQIALRSLVEFGVDLDTIRACEGAPLESSHIRS